MVLCQHFRIGKATCLQIFHEKHGLKTFHLCWVPHSISINQVSEKVSHSNLLLTALREQKAGGFQRVITGDESCLFLYYPRDSIWAASRDELA
jgi:hypothetical protein